MNFISFKKGNYNYSFPFLFALIFLFTSCNNDVDTSKIDLLYDTQYSLVDNETLVDKNSFYLDDFEKIKDSLQLPDIALYKTIKHPDYMTYIAINPYNPKKQEGIHIEDSLSGKNIMVVSHKTVSNKAFYVIYSNIDSKNKIAFNTSQFENRFEKK